MWMAPSSPQLASQFPSGLTWSRCTVPRCARQTRTHSPLCTSHQRSLPSLPPLTSTAPVGPQASAFIIALTSFKVYGRSPLCTSQTKISPLSLPPPPLASRVPSGLQATLMTMPRCPRSFSSSVPSEASHRHTLPSSPPLARHMPSGLQATRRIQAGGSVHPTHRRVPVVTSHTCTGELGAIGAPGDVVERD